MENQQAPQKSGLATASLVLGIIAVIGCWIPLLNFISIIIGILALILGIIPLLQKRSKGRAVAGVVLAAITLIIGIGMYSLADKVIDKAIGEVAELSKAEEPAKAAIEIEETPATETAAGASSYLEFLQAYEAWADEYVAFMKKYKENPTDLTLLADYTRLLGEIVEWSEKADDLEDNLTDAELTEYLAATARILKILASAQ